MNTLQFNLPPGFHPKGTKTPFPSEEELSSMRKVWFQNQKEAKKKHLIYYLENPRQKRMQRLERRKKAWERFNKRRIEKLKLKRAAEEEAQLLGRLSTGEIVGCVAFFPISLLYVAKRKIDGHYERQRRILNQLKKMSNKD